jgi:phosphoglycolate phosphatase
MFILNKMKSIFFDFDGTIVDVSERIYRLYSDLVLQYKQQTITKDIYLSLKKNKLSEELILRKTIEEDSIIKKIIRKRKELLESIYTKYDFLIPEVVKTLSDLHQNHNLYLVSYRKNEKNLLKEIRQFYLHSFFKKIIISGNSSNKTGIEFKTKAILDEHPGENDVIVGDTEDDIMTGKALGLTTVAVLSGMRSRAYLETLKPDFILSSLVEMDKVVK